MSARVSGNQFTHRLIRLSVTDKLKLRQLRAVIVASVIAAGPVFLVAHGYSQQVDDVDIRAMRLVAATSTPIQAALDTTRLAVDAEQYPKQQPHDDGADSASHTMRTSRSANSSQRTGVVPLVSTDASKSTVARLAGSSWHVTANDKDLADSRLAWLQRIAHPPLTVLHCCWRI